MSTVAWDGKTICADMQATSRYGMKSKTHKLFHNDWLVYGGNGSLVEVVLIWRWLEKPERFMSGRKVDTNRLLQQLEENPIEMDVPESDKFGFVITRCDKQIYAVEGKKPLVLCPIIADIYAAGSGSEYALAAMYCGKTAREAVEIANHFDASTGSEIEEIVL